MTDHGLSNQQLVVICALSSGATTIAAAQEAGVHRNTVNHWCRNHLPFKNAFAHAQYSRALYYREKTEALADLAFQAIQEILTDPKTPPSVRLKAALAIITTASTPPEPKKQVLLDIEKIVVKPSSSEIVTEDQFEPPEPVHNNAQPESQPVAPNSTNPPTVNENVRSVHNSAQSPQPLHAESPKVGHRKVGRNDPCPCNSGQKYKRCCLGKPAVHPEFAQRQSAAA